MCGGQKVEGRTWSNPFGAHHRPAGREYAIDGCGPLAFDAHMGQETPQIGAQKSCAPELRGRNLFGLPAVGVHAAEHERGVGVIEHEHRAGRVQHLHRASAGNTEPAAPKNGSVGSLEVAPGGRGGAPGPTGVPEP